METENKNKIPELELKTEYTFIAISEMVAVTIKKNIIITDRENDRYIFKEKGKRKQYYLTLNKDSIALFKGNIPFKVDSETNSFRGNALINVIGDKDLIKDYFNNKQLNPLFNKEYVNLIIQAPDNDIVKDQEILLYPELAINSIWNRNREKAFKQLSQK